MKSEEHNGNTNAGTGDGENDSGKTETGTSRSGSSGITGFTGDVHLIAGWCQCRCLACYSLTADWCRCLLCCHITGYEREHYRLEGFREMLFPGTAVFLWNKYGGSDERPR